MPMNALPLFDNNGSLCVKQTGETDWSHCLSSVGRVTARLYLERIKRPVIGERRRTSARKEDTINHYGATSWPFIGQGTGPPFAE